MKQCCYESVFTCGFLFEILMYPTHYCCNYFLYGSFVSLWIKSWLWMSSTHTYILLFHSAAPQQSAYSMFVHTVLTLHLVTGLDTTATLFISMKQTVHKLLDASLSFKVGGGVRMFWLHLGTNNTTSTHLAEAIWSWLWEFAWAGRLESSPDEYLDRYSR
jgi:hypothetical protein